MELFLEEYGAMMIEVLAVVVMIGFIVGSFCNGGLMYQVLQASAQMMC